MEVSLKVQFGLDFLLGKKPARDALRGQAGGRKRKRLARMRGAVSTALTIAID
jgi:hypothetical protein